MWANSVLPQVKVEIHKSILKQQQNLRVNINNQESLISVGIPNRKLYGIKTKQKTYYLCLHFRNLVFFSCYIKHESQQWHLHYLCQNLPLNVQKKEITNKKTVSMSNIVMHFSPQLNLQYKIYPIWMFPQNSFRLHFQEQDLSLQQKPERVDKENV